MKDAYNCLKKREREKSGNKQGKQASKRVGNDSANTSGQICKAAYVPFHKRAVAFGTTEPLCASGR